jgi:peroxiredoxin Q/BCP
VESKMKLQTTCLAAGALVALLSVPSVAAEGPDVGEMAPGFELPGSDGKSYDLASFAGDRAVVIAWYPKAFTGG